MTDERRLFEDLYARDYLAAGFQPVRKNKGAPGIDGVTIAEFESRLDDELSRLTVELDSWTYEPSPVRRVRCATGWFRPPKKLLLAPIFEPLFSDHNYGFRLGRNQGQAKAVRSAPCSATSSWTSWIRSWSGAA